MKLWKFLLLLILGSFIFLFVYTFAQVPMVLGLSPIVIILEALIAAPALLGCYLLWMKLFEKREVSEICLSRLLPDVALGFGIGFLYFVVIVVVMICLGLFKINGFAFDGPSIAKNLAMMLIVAVGEEIVFRGFIYRMVSERWGLIAALIISSLTFGFIHISNPGATVWSAVAIALEAGIMLGLAYRYKNTLWLPIGIHWAWNFSQGQIFGFAVSGMEIRNTVIQPIIEGNEYLTGGAFGAEASVIAVAISVVISYLLYIRLGLRKK